MILVPGIALEHTAHTKRGATIKGGDPDMARRRSVMSEELKVELAKELGFYDTVQKEGWGGITTKDAGNMVKRAIEKAEEALQNNNGS